MKVIIIGGVAGGASAAARLRRLDEKAEIIILERGKYVSFANCGLPYYIGNVIKQREKLLLQTKGSMKSRYNVEVRLQNEVVGIDKLGKTVTVKTPAGVYTEPFDRLIIATGAYPSVPSIEGLDTLPDVFNVRSVDDADVIKAFIKEKNPKNALVIGGSYIGLEMAENIMQLGIDVTVAEYGNHIITPLDFDMAADVQAYVRKKGLDLRLHDTAKSFSETEKGVEAVFKNGEKKVFDMVIVATGVKPDTAFVKMSEISLNNRGSIITDENMMTDVDNIYAVGDAACVKNFVTGKEAFIPLAGPANRQGRVAADNICSLNSHYTGTQGSSVLKIFDMTVATTGMSEESLKYENIEYDKTYIYSASHASYYPDASNISMKLIWDKKSGKILGAQAVGFDGVEKRIDVISTAMRFGALAWELASLELCYAPPFGSAKDPVNMLGFIAENIKNGKLLQFFPEDVESLPRDGSVTLLDVRTEAEYNENHIDGFMNIPLDSLRDRINEIPKDKTVYVHCFSGMRSYLAYRILVGNGYKCKNLAGGFRLYSSISQELHRI